MKNLRKFSVLTVFLLIGVVGAYGFSLTPLNTIKKVYKLLYQYDEKAPNSEAMKTRINEYFLLDDMARDAIQDHWGKMNGKQRKEYMKLMKDLLEKAVYQDTHENLQKGKVQFLGDRTRGTRSKVMTKIYIPDEDMEIDNDFLMKNFPSLWKVQDIYIDGASLIEDYRSQFNKIVREHGLEGNENALFPRLRKAVKEEKDDWRQSWKSKKDKKEKPEKKERPTLLEGL